MPFLRLSWLSPPAWKSYRATNNCGSSSSCDCNKFSFDVHRIEDSKLLEIVPPIEPPELPPPDGIDPGGSPSGRSGMWGKGRLCNNASIKIIYTTNM